MSANYNSAMDPLRAAKQARGNQPGDPARQAQALLAPTQSENSPVQPFLGDNELGLVEQALGGMNVELAAWNRRFSTRPST